MAQLDLNSRRLEIKHYKKETDLRYLDYIEIIIKYTHMFKGMQGLGAANEVSIQRFSLIKQIFVERFELTDSIKGLHRVNIPNRNERNGGCRKPDLST